MIHVRGYLFASFTLLLISNILIPVEGQRENPLFRQPGGPGGPGKKHPPGQGHKREFAPGVFVDITDLFIQRVIPQGTIYIPYETPGGKPTFKRRIADTGRHFILFPDLTEKKGTGHYILLRRFTEMGVKGERGEPLYQAYKMWLSDAARSTVINWPEEGDGARGQKATSAEKSEKAKRESNHGPEDFDAGEVVNRRRRNDLPIVAPAFSSIQVEINDNKQERFENVAQNDFEGFSIERED